MASPYCYYHYSFSVYPSPIREWGDDEQMTVKFCSLKSKAQSLVFELQGRKESDFKLSEVVYDSERSILKVRTYLTELDVPEVAHARMMAGLMHYMEIVFLEFERRQTVAMEIVMTSVEEEGEWSERWMLVDMEVEESWAWPMAAVDDIVDAVRAVKRWIERSARDQPFGLYSGPMQDDDDIEMAMSQSMEEDMPMMVLASEASIANLEKVKKGEVAAVWCVICKDEDEQGGFSRMPCKHMFHSECIETWLRTSSSCPLRAVLILGFVSVVI